MKTDPSIVYEKDDFLISFPESIDILKGSEDADEDDDPGSRKIGGIASTQSLDRQGEVVIQRGLDFTEFVNFGFFNDNHQQNTGATVGVPEMAKFVQGKGWYVEGYLLKGNKRADEIWGLAKSLQDTHRRLGFSIEGKVLKRDDNRILKAKVRHVAVTNSPVNTDCTFDVLSKAFCHIPEDECPGTCCEAGRAAMAKGLKVGYVRTEGGRMLVPEHLDGQGDRKKKKSYACPKCKKGFPTERGLDGHFATRHPGDKLAKADVEIRRESELSPEEAAARLQALRPHLSKATCERIVRLVLAGGVK